MSVKPYLAVFATWPVPEYDLQHANPATSDDGHTAVQLMITDDQAIELSKIAWLYPSTDAGLLQAKQQCPYIPWDSLGFFWGWEIG